MYKKDCFKFGGLGFLYKHTHTHTHTQFPLYISKIKIVPTNNFYLHSPLFVSQTRAFRYTYY